jgi:hypothetical protein
VVVLHCFEWQILQHLQVLVTTPIVILVSMSESLRGVHGVFVIVLPVVGSRPECDIQVGSGVVLLELLYLEALVRVQA